MIRTSHQAVAWAGVSLLFTMVAILAFSASAFADDGDGYAPGWEPISSELSTDVDPDELMARVEAGQSDVSGATVFGFDDRIPVEDTTAAPWRTIAHLYIALPGGGYGECTGTFVAPNAVITAAHCLYDDEYGDFVDSILVIPGETAFDEPFGTALASYVRVPVGWTETGSFYYDFGLITLDGDPFFGALGPYYMKIGATPDSMFANPGENVIATAGYPGDKPLGSMWFTGDFGYTYDDDYLYTQMDAYPGQSGSPVFVMDYEGDELADLYIGGIFSFETPSFNGARRLTQIIVDALVDWCAEDGCTINVQQYEDDPAPTVTATPSPTATSTPTPTASPTATPTATSTSTPPPAADGTYTYDLSFRWNLYTWYGIDGTVPEQAVRGEGPAAGGTDVFDLVTAIYGWDGGQQRWLGFFPDAIGIPGANDLLALGFGDAYWIATNESGGATWTIPADDEFDDGEPQPSPTETPTPPPTATATPTATPSPTPSSTPTPTPTEQPVDVLQGWYDEVWVIFDKYSAVVDRVLDGTQTYSSAAAEMASIKAEADGFKAFLDSQEGRFGGEAYGCESARTYLALGSGWLGLMAGWNGLIFDQWPYADYFDELQYASDQFFDSMELALDFMVDCATP